MLKTFISLSSILLLALAPSAFAQESATITDLAVEAVTVTEQQDIYGQIVQVAQGDLVNQGSTAYTSISLSAAAYNEDDEQIGEGFGYLVDSCEAGLAPDFSLQPEQAQAFTITLELFEADETVERVEVVPLATAAEPVDAASSTLDEGIEAITNQEVVQVEWNGPRSLRYAVGCDHDSFTEWTWHSYNTLSGRSQTVEHPNAANVTDALREALGLTDPLLFDNAFIRFAPSGTRFVYQNHINDLYSAAADGTLQRQIHSRLNNRTLQGIYWVDEDRFLAYYYGAYGDPVIYFTADAEGRSISPAPLNNPESVIVPGISRDARRVVIAGTFDEGTGYYLNVVTNGFFELLFEGEPAGNNYPGPIAIVNPEDDIVMRIFLARPIDGVPTLECYNRDQDVLYDIATLPINLTEGERAQWWISPDEQTIALAANGSSGGLWLIDLDTLHPCE